MEKRFCFRMVACVAALAAVPFAWSIFSPASAASQEGARVAMSKAVETSGSRLGEVVVRDKVALRIRFPAGGYSAPERADRVASRLNELSQAGRLRPEELRTGTVNGQAAVLAGDELVITADQEHARANRTTPGRLAHAWRNNLAVALGGTPIAMNARGAAGVRPVSNAAEREERLAEARAYHEEVKTKLVPILTIGSGGRIGVAQVSGPVSRVDDVKAVAQLETDFKDAARIRVLVPISTENIVSNIKRVPQVSVTGEAGLRF
jgi:hypothetical protein